MRRDRLPLQYSLASLVVQIVNNSPAMWKTWILSLGWEDPLEKVIATHSSILAWRIQWTEDPSILQSMRSQKNTLFYRDTEVFQKVRIWGLLFKTCCVSLLRSSVCIIIFSRPMARIQVCGQIIVPLRNKTWPANLQRKRLVVSGTCPSYAQ